MNTNNIFDRYTEQMIENLSETAFSLSNSIQESKKTLTELKKNNILLSSGFDDDIWLFADINSKGRTRRMNFYIIDEEKINFPADFKLILKCWVGNLLNINKPATVATSYYYLILGIKKTNCFSDEKLEQFINWLHTSTYNKNSKISLVNNILKFLDFSKVECSKKLIPRLIDISNKLNFKRAIRQLPPSKDVITFSFYLDKFFNDLSLTENCEVIKKQEILFYPILIWWKLTNIIPIRSIEFCTIQRNCLSKSGSTYFIQLPRKKQKLLNKRNVVSDKLKWTVSAR